MCDCYDHKCHFCDNEISIHIADFCVKRDTVTMICPDCQCEYVEGFNIKKHAKFFISHLDCREQVFGKLNDGRYKGKPVLFFCTDSKAYGIYIN